MVRSVSLHFTAAMSLLNYDEFYLTSDCFHSNGEMNLPCTWQTVWPGLSEAALVGLMSTLLHGACLVNLGLVCVSFLEHDVVRAANSLQLAAGSFDPEASYNT